MIAPASSAHVRFLPVVSNSASTSESRVELPGLTGRWLHEALIGGSIPEETRATCDKCPMLPAPDGSVNAGGLTFNPATKCCTYVPNLANFVVGAILVDRDESLAFGKRTLEERIEGKFGITPLGVDAPAFYRATYQLGRAGGGFGVSERLLCPHYDRGQCGIWNYRNAVCSTWFCKYNRDGIGKAFWESARMLLESIEYVVSLWCVLQLDLGIDALHLLARPKQGQITQLSAQDLDGVVDIRRYQRAWGAWVKREREFYIECARLAGELDWSAVLRIGGPELAVLHHLLRDRHAALVFEHVPAHLIVSKYTVVWTRADICRIAGQGSNHFDVPSWIPAVLHHFDGRPTGTVLACIAAESGYSIDSELISRLVDFKVLVALP